MGCEADTLGRLDYVVCSRRILALSKFVVTECHQLGNVIGAALIIVQINYGLRTHQNCPTAHQLREFQKYTYGEWIKTFATLM